MSQHEPDPEVPEEAIMDAHEAAFGRPMKVTPEEGIRAMKVRLESLQTHLDYVLKNPGLFTREGYDRALQEDTAQINDTKHRIAEYETQLKGRN